MELKMIKALWGMTGSLEEMFQQVSNAGYNGIEARLPAPEDESRFRELLEQYGFDYIAQLGRDGETIESFAFHVERAASFNPILINSHSSRDDMPYDNQLKFFEKALEIERNIRIPIGHETHRRRAMFTPWTTERLLRDLPDLSITADFSHWCCVCESLLEDQVDRLALACSRTIHIHARIGYAQGPQVPDPRDPAFSSELEAHERWWRSIIQHRRKAGHSWTTITPEFGPPNYMHTLPYTKRPVSDLWDVCFWMANRCRVKGEEWMHERQ